MFIDTHAHLTDERFDPDRPEVISRARASGVSKIIEIACEPGYWSKALELSSANNDIFCALGIHPQEAQLSDEALFSKLSELIKNPKVIAIGETGLDYHHENSTREKQREVFIKHIELAANSGKPLVVHCREAYPDLLDILNGKSYRGVVHCFSGSLQDSEKLLEMGFYLGIDGPVTYPGAKELRRVVAAIPLDRILIETDCPYLPPQPHRGGRNEPSFVSLIAKEIAMIKGIDPVEISKILYNNSLDVFKLL